MTVCGQRWQTATGRALLFAALWFIMAGPTADSWVIGAAAVATATWASLCLEPRNDYRLSFFGALRFGAFFLKESLLGGIDVSRRTLGPRLLIEPGFIDYPMRLPAGRPRVVFINCVNLLPGTLAADLKDDWLVIHVLDRRTGAQNGLERLENAVAALFGATLEIRHA